MRLETKRGEPDAANFTRGVRARAWLIAVLALLVAIGGRSLLSPWLGDALPFVFAFPAVALVSIFVGSRVGIAVALGAVLWVAIPGLPPKFSVEESGLQTLLFLPSAMVIAFVCGRATGRKPSLISTKLPIQVFEIATLQWLRFVIAVSMVLPGLIFILVGLYTYQSAMNAAADRMDRVGRIVAEHALKVF